MIAQGTPEWFSQRLGHVTASMMSHVLAVGKGGEALTRENYRWKIVAERLTGKTEQSFSSLSYKLGYGERTVRQTSLRGSCWGFSR